MHFISVSDIFFFVFLADLLFAYYRQVQLKLLILIVFKRTQLTYLLKNIAPRARLALHLDRKPRFYSENCVSNAHEIAQRDNFLAPPDCKSRDR